jgi:hypothetical protein
MPYRRAPDELVNVGLLGHQMNSESKTAEADDIIDGWYVLSW